MAISRNSDAGCSRYTGLAVAGDVNFVVANGPGDEDKALLGGEICDFRTCGLNLGDTSRRG